MLCLEDMQIENISCFLLSLRENYPKSPKLRKLQSTIFRNSIRALLCYKSYWRAFTFLAAFPFIFQNIWDVVKPASIKFFCESFTGLLVWCLSMWTKKHKNLEISRENIETDGRGKVEVRLVHLTCVSQL